MRGALRGLATALMLTLAAAPAGAAARAGAFADWAAVVVSGDDHAAHVDRPTAAFDNARRDVAAAFERVGIRPDHLAQISVHGEGDETSALSDRLGALATAAPAGCLVYITSHGSTEGVLIGGRIVPPALLAALVWKSCHDRPTAVVISACFSGRFLPAMSSMLGPKGYVLTAARPDRTSFGCGEGDRYPFFDGCVLETLQLAAGFVDLADRVRACVRAREDEEGARPRSEPQLYIGPDFPLLAPAFSRR